MPPLGMEITLLNYHFARSVAGQRSGGLITSVYKDGNPMEDGSVIASNEPVFNQFVKIIRND